MRNLLAIVFALFSAVPAVAGDLVFVADGKSQYAIVLPANASPAEQRAADELRKHLKQMSGVELPVLKDDQPLPASAILLGGSNAHLATLGVKLDPATLGDEGFVLRAVGENLVVAGTGKRGTMYGVSTLLEKLGVRWFTPTITRIPDRKTVSLAPLDETQTPAFEYREPYFKESLDKDWAARLKTNGHHAELDDSTGGKVIYGHFVHTFDKLVPPELFKDHPEYFPVIDDKRTGGYVQRCLTNPDVLKLTIEKVRKWMKKEPGATIFSVSQNDCYKFCTCDACNAIVQKYGGKQSGVYIWFVNQVAEAVEKEFPDKLIDTIAYQFTEAPPRGIAPRKNVRVRLCPLACCEAHPYEQCTAPPNQSYVKRLKKWSKLSDTLYVWHYNINFFHYLAPFPDFKQFPDSVRLYKRSGVKGIFFQGDYNSVGGSDAEMRSYVMAKLLWDVKADADALVTEWMQGVYGDAAAKPMRRWFDLLHERAFAPEQHLYTGRESPLELLTPDVLAEGNKLFDEAEKLVAGNDVATKQLEKARLSLRYGQIFQTHAKGADLDKFVADLRRLGITHVRESTDLAGWEKEFRAK